MTATTNRAAELLALTDHILDPDTRMACLVLRSYAEYATEHPSVATCWLLNAALHLEDRHDARTPRNGAY